MGSKLKKIIKKAIDYLPLLGIVFLIIYLVEKDFDWSLLKNNSKFNIIAIPILLLAFLIRGITWYIILKKFNINVRLNDALFSQFSTILLKYIPGKIWTPIGKANSLRIEGEATLIKLSSIAFLQQLLFTSVGLLFGSLSILLFIDSLSLKILLVAIVSLSTYLFVSYLSKERTLNKYNWKYLKKLSDLKLPKLIIIFPFIIIHWLLIGLGYFIIYRSTVSDINWNVGMIQVLANNIGMIAVFVPAGIGVREGIVAIYLLENNYPNNLVIAISILSRIVFIIAEIIIYIISFLIKKRK